MRRSLWLLSFLSLALVAHLGACGGTTSVTVSLSPSTVTLEPGDQQVFVASVAGTPDASVTWAATGGTLEGSGATVTFTAPIADGAYEVTATSNVDAAARAVASITVAATAIDDATNRIDETGGVLFVDSGAVVDVPPGGMAEAGDFRVRTYDRSRAYDGAIVAPISLEVAFEVPVASLALGDEEGLFYIGVPATDLTAESTVALVFVDIDGVRYEFVSNYHPIDENAIPIYFAQLNALFDAHGSVPDSFRITVQPVAFQSDAVSGEAVQASSTRTGGLYRLLPDADLARAQTICASNNETSAYGGFTKVTTATTLPSGRVPLVLVHGWQELGVEKDAFQLREKAGYNAALCGWLGFMEYFRGEAALNSRYELYSFGYDSRDAISLSAAFLRNVLRAAFVDQPVVVLAHSMGGLVSDRLIQTMPNDVHHLITLGTPYRGTRFFMCTESNGSRCTQMRMTAGVNKLPLLSAVASSGDGTLDLTWEFGGIEYPVARICEGGVCQEGSGLTLVTVPNPVLVAQNVDLSSARRANYNAIYGLISGRASGLGLAEQLLFEASGLSSDGVVPTQSACLSRSIGVDNNCAESAIFPHLRSFVLDHNELKNVVDGGTYPYLKQLLQAVWPAPSTPDVEVSVAPTTATLAPGGTRSFTATVSNAGNTSVTWSTTCGSIAGSNSTITYTAPGAAGSCSVTATSLADASKSASATVTVTSGTPTAGADLVVRDLSVTPTAAVAGANVTVAFRVENIGDAPAGPSTVRVRLNDDPTNVTTSDALLAQLATSALAAGQAQAYSRTVSLPSGLADGTHYVWVVADVFNEANQSNYDNDRSVVPIVIGGASDDCRDPEQPISFPDAGLRDAIVDTLELLGWGSVVDCAAMARLPLVNAYAYGISDLRGLEYAVNATDIHLAGNRIEDLEPLRSLDRLAILDLGGNEIADLEPLADLDGLLQVWLSDNRIRDLAGLGSQRELRFLYLSGNDIRDIGELEALGSIEILDLDHNSISDIAPLASLRTLTGVSLLENSVTDIRPLRDLDGLTGLNLSGNDIVDIGPLQDLDRLVYLDLAQNRIVHLSPLKNLTALKGLNLRGNRIVDVVPLVLNTGLGNGDHIDLSLNCLDLAAGSTASLSIDVLEGRGANVIYLPQANCD